MTEIDPRLVDIALERVQGTVFEQFANEFFPALLGVDYVPMGGTHDGGADAFGGDPVKERSGRAGQFFQASVQQDIRSKIRHTVTRLNEFRRVPTNLTLLTSRSVSTLDVVEDSLSEELDVTIRIRDAAYIRAHVNDTPATRGAFHRYLEPLTTFLRGVGASTIVTASSHVQSPAVYVFLRQEVDKLDGNVPLVDSVTDSLGLWALEGTDPDRNVFLEPAGVIDRVVEVIPSSRSIITPRMPSRLDTMAEKDYPGGRAVRRHQDPLRYALPWETRRRIADDNRDDESLRIEVSRRFELRAQQAGVRDDLVTKAAAVALRAIQFSFEEQGLEFAHYLTGERDVEFPQMADAVRHALEDLSVSGPDGPSIASGALQIARDCVYSGDDSEREYLRRLARTYALLFTLNSEPRLVEYFEGMANDFNLFVGSDLILRALSERYLPEESQMARNMLLMAAQAGVGLALTEPVLDEAIGHLRSSDRAFWKDYAAIEDRLTTDFIREVPRLLIRAYLYNRQSAGGPNNWQAFVNQFCTYQDLHRERAREDLRRYLMATFRMTYVTRDELYESVDYETVTHLAHQLEVSKSTWELAENDALLAAAVYGFRQHRGETSEISEFGYKTWWLTNETAILRLTRGLERDNGNVRYMMRPDFLLNFFSFAPSALDARRTFANVFPSSLGIQLSKRMDEDAFESIIQQVHEAEQLEEGRRLAIMATCADTLKSDFSRRYHLEL